MSNEDRPKIEVHGHIDTTYHTQQRDMFASGLAAAIGVHAYAVWNAVKYHADFQTGRAWPGIRRLAKLTGCADKTVQAAIRTLSAKHLLRVEKKGQRNVYVARERMDVRVGDRVICTVVMDFVPATMRERLAKLKGASSGDLEKADVWAEVELIPGPGMTLDEGSGSFKTRLLADEVPPQIATPTKAADARQQLRQLADDMRAGPKRTRYALPKK